MFFRGRPENLLIEKKMYCLQWLIPVLLLPKPVKSNVFILIAEITKVVMKAIEKDMLMLKAMLFR